MSTSLEALAFGASIMGLIGFVYSWLRLLETYQEKSFGWRDWVSLAAIALASAAALLRFVMPLFWGSDFGVKVRIAELWTAVCVLICALALLLGFVGRLRLALPIAFACFGTAVFWVMSTVP